MAGHAALLTHFGAPRFDSVGGNVAQQATCPDCGVETGWIATIENGELGTRIQSLCDGCQADRAVANAYAGTDY